MSSYLMQMYEQIIAENAPMSLEKILETEIQEWLNSDKRMVMVKGEEYYEGKQDILEHTRYTVGDSGERIKLSNVHNAQKVDNQYSIHLDKKVNYSFGKPMTIKTEDDHYTAILGDYFNLRFMKLLRRVGYEAMEGGVGYVHPHYDESGVLRFKLLDNKNVLPFYADVDREKIDCYCLLHERIEYKATEKRIIELVDFVTLQGINRYERKEGRLKLIDQFSHLRVNDTGQNWQRIPLIPFRYNFREVPLLTRIKSLQDGINLILSVFENNMMEDARNTILVIHNYDGEDPGRLRRNLASTGIIKVRSDGERRGGVETLSIEVNSENYKTILQIFKTALIENARSFDAKDERIMNDPNMMTIRALIHDMDNDAEGMETEFKPALQDLVWFINQDLANRGKGLYDHESVEFIFNRDSFVNETEVIANINASAGLLSKKTQLEQHPWIDDVTEELERLEEEKEESLKDMFGLTFRKELDGDEEEDSERDVLDSPSGSGRKKNAPNRA
mgnify:CR=1 FL=1